MENLKEDVAHLHENGLQVNWFGASEEEPIRQLADAGIDFILTDDLDLCLTILKEYGVQPVKTSKE
jgi:glycerophosphoryl diester phosphodiesterase